MPKIDMEVTHKSIWENGVQIAGVDVTVKTKTYDSQMCNRMHALSNLLTQAAREFMEAYNNEA